MDQEHTQDIRAFMIPHSLLTNSNYLAKLKLVKQEFVNCLVGIERSILVKLEKLRKFS
jgi:hypothetical protein